MTKIFGDEAEILENTNTLITNLALVSAVTAGIPTLTETGGTVTTDGTEQDVYINATPLGIFNPICFKINCSAHTAGETIILRTYYQEAAGVPARILQNETTYAGLISPELLSIDLDPNRFGVSVTIEKTAGANRAYPWEVFYEM